MTVVYHVGKHELKERPIRYTRLYYCRRCGAVSSRRSNFAHVECE